MSRRVRVRPENQCVGRRAAAHSGRARQESAGEERFLRPRVECRIHPQRRRQRRQRHDVGVPIQTKMKSLRCDMKKKWLLIIVWLGAASAGSMLGAGTDFKVTTDRTLDSTSLELIVQQVSARSGAKSNDEKAIAIY